MLSVDERGDEDADDEIVYQTIYHQKNQKRKFRQIDKSTYLCVLVLLN